MASITIEQGNTHTSTQGIPPLSFPSSSSVCRRRGDILWAHWAALFSSTCLLNDSNYFPGLQATHACFISTSTSPICLHGDAWCTLWWNEKSGREKKQKIILFLSLPSYGSPLGSPVSVLSLRRLGFLWCQGSFCRD